MTLKIACVQSDIIARDPSANFKHLDEIFNKIQDDRDIIVLPETFTTGFPAEPELFAEDENGPTMTWLHKKANERNCVICGSFITSFSQQTSSTSLIQNYHNTFVWMNPDGSYHTYDKRHTECMTLARRKTSQLWQQQNGTCYHLRNVGYLLFTF